MDFIPNAVHAPWRRPSASSVSTDTLRSSSGASSRLDSRARPSSGTMTFILEGSEAARRSKVIFASRCRATVVFPLPALPSTSSG